MKKILKKWGNGLIVSFSREEQKIHNMKEGKVIDLSDMIVEDSLYSNSQEHLTNETEDFELNRTAKNKIKRSIEELEL